MEGEDWDYFVERVDELIDDDVNNILEEIRSEHDTRNMAPGELDDYIQDLIRQHALPTFNSNIADEFKELLRKHIKSNLEE